jgi:hypothetical protein
MDTVPTMQGDVFELHFVLVAALLVCTIASAIACVAFGRSPGRFARALPGICRKLASAVLAIGALGTLSGLVLTIGSVAAPGLSEADRARMWTNGIAEALYNMGIALIVALPTLLVGRLVGRRSDTSR